MRGKKTGGTEDQKKNQDYPDNSTVKLQQYLEVYRISQETEYN